MQLIQVRKIAAFNILFRGGRRTVMEYALTIVLCGIFGAWFLGAGISFRSDPSVLLILLGVFLVGVALNYLPLLWYAIRINGSHRVRDEIAAELLHPQQYQAMYSQQSLLLSMIPLALCILALIQEVRNR